MGYLDYTGLQYLWGKLKEKFAPKSHSHDDRYYTESEMDGKLNSKVNNNEAGANGLLSKLTTSWTAAPTDNTYFIRQNIGGGNQFGRVKFSTIWNYIKGKTDGIYQPKGSYAASGHTHDDRYYTESEMNTKLSKKAENIVLANDANLNSITTPGFYSCGGGNKITNKPNNTDAIGLIVTHNASGSYYTQILTTSSNANTYRRTCLNGTWSGWTQDKYTDTNTWRGIQNNLTSDSTSDSLSAAQGKALKSLVDGKAPNGHTHNSIKDAGDNRTLTLAYSKDSLAYGSYSWLAGWNGSELRAVGKWQFATAENGITASGSNYVRFGNGTQMCWGITDCKDKKVTANFAVAFNNTNYAVTIMGNYDSWADTYWITGNHTTTSFAIKASGGSVAGRPINWIAVGTWK